MSGSDARRVIRTAAPFAIALAIIAALLGLRAGVARDPLHGLPVEPTTATLAPSDPVARAGYVYLPRGGPYRFALQSPGPATAELEHRSGVQAISTDPMRPTRIVLEPGAAKIRVTAPPGARLLWHPPGRVSDVTLEYVPAGALAPTPRSFDASSSSSPGDAFFAAAIALTLLALVLYLARRRLRAAGRDLVIATLAILILAAAVRLIDVGGAGQTWDEDVNWSAGRNYAQNVLALDASPPSWLWNYEHPPVSKYLAGIGALWQDGYDAARAVMALVMALGCALLVPIGTRLFGLRAGVLAGGIAALTPHLIAHGKVVGHEAPTVLWWSLALLLCLGAHDDDPPARRLAVRLAVIGVVLGLAIATRFVNALLAVPIGLTLVALAPPGTRRRTVGWGLAIVPAVAVLTIVLLWPRLWSQPLLHLVEAWARLRKPHGAEPYLGAITNQPPLSYFAMYLLATAPAGVLALAVAGVARIGRAWSRERRSALILAIWLLAPLGVMASPVRQDGVRYVMPCLTALALLAGAGADGLLSLARQRVIAAIGAGAIAAYLVVVAVRIHPYYLDYYGELAGGPGGVARHKRFETAWWGEGLDRAVAYVNRHAAPGARLHRDCIDPSHLAWFRADLWPAMVRDPKQAEWIVVYAPLTRGCPVPADARLVHEVMAQGAPMARVYQRTLAPPAAAGQAAPP
jgi:4-amino-4-deoxy-L-arabinose transferase-like glycosyltransferase